MYNDISVHSASASRVSPEREAAVLGMRHILNCRYSASTMNGMKRSATDAGLNERTEDSHLRNKKRKSFISHVVGMCQATYSTVSSMLWGSPSDGSVDREIGDSENEAPFVDLSGSDHDVDQGPARAKSRPSSEVVELIDLTACPSPQIPVAKKKDVPMQPHANRQSASYPTDQITVRHLVQPSQQRRSRLFYPYMDTGSYDNPVQLAEKEKYRELLHKRSMCNQLRWPTGQRNITARNLEGARDKQVYRSLLSSLSDGKLQVSVQERPTAQKIPRLFSASGSRSKVWPTKDSQIPKKSRPLGSFEDRMSSMKSVLSFSATNKLVSSEGPIDVDKLPPKEKQHECESSPTGMIVVKEIPGTLSRKPPIRSPDVTYTGTQTTSRTAISKLNRREMEQPEVIMICDSPEAQPVAPVVRDIEIKSSPPVNFRKTRYDKKWVDALKSEHYESHRQRKIEVSKAEKVQEESRRHEEEIEREIEEKVKQLDLASKTTEKVSLMPLTQDQLELVNSAFIPQPVDEVLSEAFNISIKRRDVGTLRGLEWLNDEIINFYFSLIADRSKKQSDLPKVHVMSSFFYPSLVTNGYSRVKRWTKKVDIFSMDLVLLPVHLGIHWCLAVIDFRKCCISYYDSMKGVNEQCLQALASYVPQESQDKLKKPFSMDGWRYETVQDIPEQMNGSDCGVFSCKFAEYVSRDATIDFSQDTMPYFRRRMVYEILNKELL